MSRPFTAALAMVVALQAQAVPQANGSMTVSNQVFRCEPPSGSPSLAVYTDQPCPKGREVQAQDPRTREQQRAASTRAQEEGRWAEAMARQRAQEERLLAARQQRQPSVIGKEKVEISRSARSDALRDAELRRMARPHQPAARPMPPEPPAAAGGSAPKATPGRP